MPASVDTWIDAANPDTNYGTDLSLFIQSAGGPEQRTLMKFNPSPSTIVSAATLYLHVETLGPGATIYVYRVTTDWGTVVTWNTAAFTGWNTPGGDYDSTPLASFQPPFNDCIIQLDITALAQYWVAAPLSNFGIILIASGPATQTGLTASESLVNAPSLVIAP